MPASMWLQLAGETDRVLRNAIAQLAAQHGTLPFQPHLTVCGFPDLELASAAADYARRSGLLPLRVTKAGISFSTVTPFKAVVIDIENSHELHSFRSALRRIAGAPEFEPPHISLLYTIDAQQNLMGWATDDARLWAIAQDCEARIAATEFVLDNPVVVAPDGGWTNIRSWKIIRKL
jgi:hypothetical protein